MSEPEFVLETERLLLRRFRRDDIDALAVLYADPEIRRYFPDGTRTRQQTREELDWFVDVGYSRHGFGLWATILGATGEFIGRCGLLPQQVDGRGEVEVAYLLDKRYWGRGLATEAARAIVDYAFASLPVDRLICMFDPDNAASRAVATKAGMTAFRLGYVDEYGVSDVYAVERPAQ